MEERKADEKTVEALLIHRDICMEAVRGESYRKFAKSTEKIISGIEDILDKIFK